MSNEALGELEEACIPILSKIEKGDPLSPEEVQLHARWTLDSLMSKFPQGEVREGLETFLSLQCSEEGDFLERYTEGEVRESDSFLEMLRIYKHGAVGGEAGILEHAERQSFIAGLEWEWEAVQSWNETARLIKGEDKPRYLGGRRGCAGWVYRFNRYLTELNKGLNQNQKN